MEEELDYMPEVNSDGFIHFYYSDFVNTILDRKVKRLNIITSSARNNIKQMITRRLDPARMVLGKDVAIRRGYVSQDVDNSLPNEYSEGCAVELKCGSDTVTYELFKVLKDLGGEYIKLVKEDDSAYVVYYYKFKKNE